MSNVHGFRDLNNNNENDGRNNDLRSNLRSDFQSVIEDERKQSFCSFLKNTFCIGLSFFSFTCLMSLFIFSLYIVTLFWGIESSEKSFLKPNSKGDLFMALYKDPFKLKNGEIWRFITYSFLHNDLSHVVFNTITLLIFGNLMEKIIKAHKMVYLWLVTGILGILFSSLIKLAISVGASVCIFGIIGGYVSLNY